MRATLRREGEVSPRFEGNGSGNALQEAREEALVAVLAQEVEEAEGRASEDGSVLEKARRKDGNGRPLEFVVAEEGEGAEASEDEGPNLGCVLGKWVSRERRTERC